MASSILIALIQACTPASPSAALAHLEPLIRSAAAQGAQFILTPEATNFIVTDPTVLEQLLRNQDDDSVILRLRELASDLGIWLLIGSAIVHSDYIEDSRAANRSLLIDDEGCIRAIYDKIHLFDVDLPSGERWRESDTIRPGECAVTAKTPWGLLGLSICYDVRFPQLYRAMAKAGTAMISVPAAFTVSSGEAHWETLLRARAIETGCWILAPAQGGKHEDNRRTWGRSTVVAPWGDVVAKLDHDNPGVLLATLDFASVDQARAAIPQLAHDRDFSLTLTPMLDRAAPERLGG